MLRQAAIRRYIDNLAYSGHNRANEDDKKNDSAETLRKMNPSWTFQSNPSVASYHYANPWPAHYQYDFNRRHPSGGPNQQVAFGGYSSYQQADYGSEPSQSAQRQPVYGGAESTRHSAGPAVSWQRPQADTYRPDYSGNLPIQQREQADIYRPQYYGSPHTWQGQHADTYRPIYSRPPPPWRRTPADNNGEWRSEAVYSTASPSQQTGFTFERPDYLEHQYQYAQSHFQYQQLSQFAMLHNAVMQELMPQWQSGNNVPANGFTPLNSANPPFLDPNVQPFIPNHQPRPIRQLLQPKVQSQGGASPSGIEVVLNPQSTTRSQRRKNRQAVKDAHAQPDQVIQDIALRPRRGYQPEKQHVMSRPVPTERYLKKANKKPQMLKSGRPLLVILDLNGTLIHRPSLRGGTRFTTRPKVDEFLHYLFSEHHVLLWSSVMPVNLDTMARKLLSKEQLDRLIGCWARDKLRIPQKDFHDNVYVYKQLSWIWKDEQIIAANPDPVEIWSQENTVLIEDSVDKTASEPFNAILVEEFKGEKQQMQSDVLGQVVRYLETLKHQSDVSAYMKSEPFKYDEDVTPFDWMPIINDMH